MEAETVESDALGLLRHVHVDSAHRDGERPRAEVRSVKIGRQRPVRAVQHGDTLSRSALVGRPENRGGKRGDGKRPTQEPTRRLGDRPTQSEGQSITLADKSHDRDSLRASGHSTDRDPLVPFVRFPVKPKIRPEPEE